MAGVSVQCYCPLRFPDPGTGPGCPGRGPAVLGPGARFTGPRAFGLADARDMSFCRFTPFAADPGFTFDGFPPPGFSLVERKKKCEQV